MLQMRPGCECCNCDLPTATRNFLIALLITATMGIPVGATAGIVEDKATATRMLVEKMSQGKYDISEEIYALGKQLGMLAAQQAGG